MSGIQASNMEEVINSKQVNTISTPEKGVNIEQMNAISMILKDLENKHDITIIYAVEAGSRAWGFGSKDSDYDIRFIFRWNDVKRYISMKKYDETINGFSKDDLYDWDGWDIKKALKHLKESNPSILEWLYSPIVYKNDEAFLKSAREIISKMHTDISLMYHYKSMAYTNWITYIKDNEKVNCKKYLYVIRPIGTLHWLMNNPQSKRDVFLIIDFDELIMQMKNDMPEGIYDEIVKLLIRKRTTENLNNTDRIEKIDNWITSQLERFDKLSGENKVVSSTTQPILSTFKKLENEVKKVSAIGAKNRMIAREDYLSAIGFCLQVLWYKQNPDKNSTIIPSKIGILLKEVILSEDIVSQIEEIIETKVTSSVENPHCKMTIIRENLVTFLRSLWIISNKDKNIPENINDLVNLPYFDDSTRKEIIKYYMDFNIKNDNLLAVIVNSTVQIFKVFGGNDSHKLDIDVKNYLSDNKTKSYCLVNDKINEWFDIVMKENAEYVKMKHQELLNIRDINTQNRYNNSIAKIDIDVFDDLLNQVIKI
jgi:predicted nucleotidyltransferase